MNIERLLSSELKRARKSVLLLGPRQTGKSTLMKELRPELTINLADERVFVDHLKDPGLLRSEIREHRKIFVDEIQRIPSMLNTIQALVDENPALQFLLTGSSARKLRRGQANLLPGRILAYQLGPFTREELGSRFDLKTALSRGLLPAIYLEPDERVARKILRTYSIHYLKEEIQAEALTRDLEGFARFFDVAASRSGSSMDFTKFGSEASIERMSAKRYFDILIDTLVVTELPPFSPTRARRLVQHSKYYFFDVGVLNGALGHFDSASDRIGYLLEHLVLQLLVSSARSHDHSFRVSAYRTSAGAEVDFIFEREGDVFAIEVKASRNVGKRDLQGLKSFSEFFGKPHRSLIIYLGETPRRVDGIDILPFDQALLEMGY